MNVVKVADGKKTYSGLIILALTPVIASLLKQAGFTDDGTMAATIAGYAAGGVVTVIGIVHKWIKSKKAK